MIIENFLNYLRHERGAADNTVTGYRYDLNKLEAWLAETDLELTSLSRSELREFVAYLSHQGLHPASIGRIVAAVRGLFRFLLQEGTVASDPTEFLDTPQKTQFIPRFLNRAETQLLMERPNVATFDGIRDRAILELLYASGLRVSELVGMKVGDLDTARPLVTVTGKGSKQRQVPCSRGAVGWVTAYLEQYRPEKTDTLFPVTRQEVWKIVTKHAKAAGLADVTPHTLRHTIATHIMQSGAADIRFVQAMLGHASIATTQIYTHITSDDLRASYNKFHPRATAA